MLTCGRGGWGAVVLFHHHGDVFQRRREEGAVFVRDGGDRVMDEAVSIGQAKYRSTN
jgi:hypothetical protein